MHYYFDFIFTLRNYTMVVFLDGIISTPCGMEYNTNLANNGGWW